MGVLLSGLIDGASTLGKVIKDKLAEHQRFKMFTERTTKKCNKHYPRYQLLMYGVRHSPPILESVVRARIASSDRATTILLGGLMVTRMAYMATEYYKKHTTEKPEVGYKELANDMFVRFLVLDLKNVSSTWDWKQEKSLEHEECFRTIMNYFKH